MSSTVPALSRRWMPHAALALAASALAASGCELREVAITEPERAVVAETYVWIGLKQMTALPRGTEATPFNRAAVFLHETLDAAGEAEPVRGARVRITRVGDGLVVDVPESRIGLGSCMLTYPADSTGTCYVTASDQPGVDRIMPGDRLGLTIDLPDGGRLVSETVVPGRFELRGVSDGGQCTIAPLTGTGIEWSRSGGAWAYISDTSISGLRRTFDAEEVSDPLYLWGLSVSALDTAIVFPREFGVFARGELDRDVSILLQRGLPDSTSALVTVAAVDRNWVNWARGGNFNPSGQVRVPSVRGDGTGVFGSAVVRSFRVLSRSQGSGPRCPPDVGARAVSEHNHVGFGIRGR
jgi:hypothetical protein